MQRLAFLAVRVELLAQTPDARLLLLGRGGKRKGRKQVVLVQVGSLPTPRWPQPPWPDLVDPRGQHTQRKRVL